MQTHTHHQRNALLCMALIGRYICLHSHCHEQRSQAVHIDSFWAHKDL